MPGPRVVAAALLAEQRITREASPDGFEDQRLREVIDLGHDVLGRLQVDSFELLVALELEGTGTSGDLDGEGQLLGPIAAFRTLG